MQSTQMSPPDAQPLASTSSCTESSPSRTRTNERSRRKRHLASGMLALLCGSTAGAMDDLMSPIERSRRDGPPSPAVSKGSVDEKEGGHATSESAYASLGGSSKPKPVRLPSRRPSVRQRMQTLSRMSDRALSTAAGSFLRRGSASHCNAPPAPSHSRGASFSSFTSGKSSGSSSSKRVIGSPSAFKHQFHLGSDAQPSSPWDESRWRQIVEMKTPEFSEEPDIIDVSSSASKYNNTDPASLQPRASTSSEYCGPVGELSRSLSLSRSHGYGHGRSASHSQPGSEDGGFAAFAAKMASATASSPNLLVLANGSSVNLLGEDGKTPKHLKRSSLVKRKPVPPLYPDVPSPALSPTHSGTSPSTAPASKTEFHLMPDLPVEPTLQSLSPTTPVAPAKKDESPVPASPINDSPFPPEHIVVSRATSPAPTIPPRRHTLAHTTSIRCRSPSNLPAKKTPTPTIDTSVASVSEDTPTDASVSTQKPIAIETVEEEREKSQDASPKPSFSSLISASASESESSPEPRTPTDDRRASAGSAASVGVLIIGSQTCAKTDDADADADSDTVSPVKRRSPPARRSPVDEETVYVTADEDEAETE